MSDNSEVEHLSTAHKALLDSHTKLQAEVAKQQRDLSIFATLPIGTILPFYGDVAQLAGTGWFACTAENAQANPRIPNLEGTFLMGVRAEEKGVRGGRSTLTPQGGHDHGGRTAGFGYNHGEINWARGPGRQDPYSHHHGIPGVGDHDHGSELRPPFFGVCFIIRLDA